MDKKEIDFAIKFCCITGIIMFIVYPLMISTHGYRWWNYVLEIIFGPGFIISYIGLYLFIKQYGNSFYNFLAIVFHILAGLAVLITNVVQKSVFTIGRGYNEIENEVSKEIIQKTHKLGNLTQLGFDYTFDVLVSTATIFIAFAMLRQNFYPKWLVIPGVLIGAGGLIVNTIEFPIPPAASGLFDPGPFYAIFTAFLFFPMIYQVYFKKQKNEIL
ncbi:DUF4386 family protein [Flavobacteriaceae bacterium R38]|nr:DUF4386 family protein [Flavobacteriaceae bacterium R38]